MTRKPRSSSSSRCAPAPAAALGIVPRIGPCERYLSLTSTLHCVQSQAEIARLQSEAEQHAAEKQQLEVRFMCRSRQIMRAHKCDRNRSKLLAPRAM